MANALGEELEWVEERCETLASHGPFLRRDGDDRLPDGTVVERYRFTHWIYRDILQQRVSAPARRQYHLKIADRGRLAYGERVPEIAGELAVHYLEAQSFDRAVEFMRMAARKCRDRRGRVETIGMLERALGVIEELPAAERAEKRATLLVDLGLVYRAGGDMPSAVEALERALQPGDGELLPSTRTQANLYLASALSWINRERCLAAVATAVGACADAGDGELEAHTRASAAYWHLLWDGWPEAGAGAVEEARGLGDPVLRSQHTVRHSFFLSLSSDYAAAAESAALGCDQSREVGEWFDYLLGHYYRAWALLHAGRWGAMRAGLDEAIANAERNGHGLWSLLFRLEEAWLHLEARDFAGAGRRAQEQLGRARELNLVFGRTLAAVLLGQTHLAAGQPDEALRLVESAGLRPDHRVLMDWVLLMPAAYGRTRAHLARGELQAAREAAGQLLESAGPSGERTYLALAHRTLADAALAEEDGRTAEAEAKRALKLLEGEPVPLAAWRVHKTAASVHADAHSRKAARHRREAAAGLEALGDSLPADDPLRDVLAGDSVVQGLRG